MPVIVPAQPLPLDRAQRRKLAAELGDMIGAAFEQHRKLTRRIELYWEWYDGKPAVEERSTPFPNASNIVYPLIKIHADSIHARRYLTLLPGSDVWAARSRHEQWAPISRQVVDFVNHEADDNAFDLATPLSDALLEGTVCPDGIVALQWGTRVRHRFIPGERHAETVGVPQGPHIFSVPSSQIFWQADRGLANSEYVIRRSYMTWYDLTQAVQHGGWDADAVRKIRTAHAEDSDGYRQSLALTDLAPRGPERFKPYEVLECWLHLPLVRGTLKLGAEDTLRLQHPAVVVYYHPDTNSILHVMAHPYPIMGWPFYQFSWKRATERGQARGLAKDLDHLQRATSTMTNQAIDAVTLQNSFTGLTGDPDLIGKRFTPGQLVYTMEPERTNFNMRPTAFIQPNIQNIQLLLTTAERISGMADPAFGVEQRGGGHPQPATSTLALLQQGQTRLARTLSFDRLELSRLGEDIAALYQHYEARTNGQRIRRVLGDRDGERVMDWLFPEDPVAGRIAFDVRALTDSLNPESEFQRAVQVDQVVTNFYAKMLQGINVLMQFQSAGSQGVAPEIVQMGSQLLFHSFQAYIASVTRALEAAGVDDLERFVGMIQEAEDARNPDQLNAALAAARTQAEEGLRATAGANQGPAVATGPGGAPAASPGLPGAGGAQPPPLGV